MADIYRIRCTWTGFAGAPGVTTFFAAGGNGVPTISALHDAFDAWHYVIPQGTNIHIENSGDTLDDATGALTGTWATGAVADVQGSGAGGYSGAEGVLLQWQTEGIHNNRHLRGRTFLVPIISSQFTGNGVIPSALVTPMNTGAGYIVNAAGPKFVVWGRPRKAYTNPKTGKQLPAAPGTSSPITGFTVAGKTAVLRSRRD